MTTNQAELFSEISKYTYDPFKFSLIAFDWKTLGFEQDRPMDWAIEIYQYIKEQMIKNQYPIKIAVASGHGITKSATASQLILWALATCDDARVVVTANTEPQLRTKTWAELSRWHNVFLLKDFFKYTATSVYSTIKGHEKSWRADAIAWSISKPESFAGLHNKGKRILVIFDEASAIDNQIWEVTEGALTDSNTEIIWIAFGNPTRNSGRFYDCFHKYSNTWKTWQIDSRTVPTTNKKLIQEWAETYGEDSDFFRVRVKGEFPVNAMNNFIPVSLVEEARKRYLREESYKFAPAVIGVDSAWTGGDEIAIVLRQGLYSKILATLPKNEDDVGIANMIARFQDEYNAKSVFIDQAYGTGIFSVGKNIGRLWTLIHFGSKSFHPNYYNKRAEMWGEMKKWLEEGGVIPDDPKLAEELTSPEYFVRSEGKIQLERKDDMKKRGLRSPNRADALALTFAMPVIDTTHITKIESYEDKNYDPLKY